MKNRVAKKDHQISAAGACTIVLSTSLSLSLALCVVASLLRYASNDRLNQECVVAPISRKCETRRGLVMLITNHH